MKIRRIFGYHVKRIQRSDKYLDLMLNEYKDQTNIWFLCYTNTKNKTGIVKKTNIPQTDPLLMNTPPCLNFSFSSIFQEV